MTVDPLGPDPAEWVVLLQELLDNWCAAYRPRVTVDLRSREAVPSGQRQQRQRE